MYVAKLVSRLIFFFAGQSYANALLLPTDFCNENDDASWRFWSGFLGDILSLALYDICLLGCLTYQIHLIQDVRLLSRITEAVIDYV